MPESEAKKRWMKENTVVYSVKVNKNTEQDLLTYLEGKPTPTVFKQALREYMERHPMECRYGMRLRGYSPGAQPDGVQQRCDDPTGRYHDIIVYNRRLSDSEIREYDLDSLN